MGHRAATPRRSLPPRLHGHGALDLNNIFQIKPRFFERIDPAIALTRSFLHPDYEGAPLALALLWSGPGQVVAAHPEVQGLFGSVTISSSTAAASRAILVESLRRHHADGAELRALVQARIPFVPPGSAHQLLINAHAGEPIESLRDTIRAPDGSPRSIPPLIRHYLSMNARFLSFHVEPSFGDALYCLLRVDLTKAPLAHLRRFMGGEAARQLRPGVV